MPTPEAASPIDSFLLKLYRLGRRQLELSLLSLGSLSAHRAASLGFWLLIAFLSFFLFLALNIALGFALSTLVGGSAAWGFLYLALGYAGLILLAAALRRAIEARLRAAVAQEVLLRMQRINEQLDQALPELRYESSLERSGKEAPYTALQRSRGRGYIERSRELEAVLREVRYLQANYKSIVAQAAQREALSYAAQLPLIGKTMRFFGYKERPQRPIRPKVSPKQPSSSGYTPYLEMAWDILRPMLMSIAMSQLQQGLTQLLFGRRSKGRR